MKQDVKQELAAALKKMKMAEGPLIRGCGIGPTSCVHVLLALTSCHLSVVCASCVGVPICFCCSHRAVLSFYLSLSYRSLASVHRGLTRLRMVLCATGFRLLLAVCSPLRQPSG